MSLDEFVKKCGSWGLLPNNGAATALYANMLQTGPMGPNNGYSSRFGKLFMRLPDISAIDSLQKLKSADVETRIFVVVACHEIFHNLHHVSDSQSFDSRSKTKDSDFCNEEEKLTITGRSKMSVPGTVQSICNPALFNENSLCKILRLSLRGDHKSGLTDAVDQSSYIDFDKLPDGRSLVDIWDV